MITLPIDRLLNHIDPLGTPPWPDLRFTVTREMMEHAYHNRIFEDHHALPLDDRLYCDGREHASRVAWLAHHGWDDTPNPIHIDTSAFCVGEWPIEDGNHRVCAAILRGDSSIRCDVSGFESDIAAYLGRDIADQVFDGEDTPCMG